MKVVTVPGQTYVVYAAEGATITAPGVKDPLLTCEWGKPNYVTVPGGEMEISDPEATYAACRNFKRAALALGLLGGGKNAKLLKYAQCVSVGDMLAVDANYKNDLTAKGEWVYPLPKLKNENGSVRVFENSPLTKFKIGRLPELASARNFFRGAKKLKELKLRLPKCTTIQDIVSECTSLEVLELELGTAVQSGFWDISLNASALKRITIKNVNASLFNSSFMYNTKLVFFETDAQSVTNINQAFYAGTNLQTVRLLTTSVTQALHAFYKCSSLSEFPTKYPALSNGNNMFSGCQLSGAAAKEILESLPVWTSGEHLITVGCHVDGKTDEALQLAIENAEAKGWTVTVQWNGTATAQASATYGLCRQPIYAKLGTMEQPDGTTEHVLDWGHYVTNWEENGYMEFASVDAARDFWGLTDYVDPEAEELLTEA